MAENFFNGSETSGSPIAGSVPNPNNIGGGETQDSGVANNGELKIDPDQHKELESLVGRQGQELGEYRKFFTDISPLLEKLDKSPELVQAIIDGDLTPELAKAAIEGKISVQDAQIVDKANAEVKKDLGSKEYKQSSAEEIQKLVEEKAKEIRAELQKELKERDDSQLFESSVTNFIERTPDFSEYAADIDKWLDKHEDVTDIAVAYFAVKGEMSVKEAEKKADLDKVEAEKNAALNMGGGNYQTHIAGNNEKIIDSLIAPRSNPNMF
jgi:uncharacterized protein (DUF1810 family)